MLYINLDVYQYHCVNRNPISVTKNPTPDLSWVADPTDLTTMPRFYYPII